MKYTLISKFLCLLSLFIFSHTSTKGQNKAEADTWISEGVALHDKGDYEAAIAKYDKALELDKDNLLALVEKAYSLTSLKKYEEAILCSKKAIDTYPGEQVLNIAYSTYGNALDGLKKGNEALEIYDKGISQFPKDYLLYFNKGVTLSSLEKYGDAILCFQKAVTYNPKHASSHNALARLLQGTDKRIPAMLAYCRVLSIEPQGSRAEGNLVNLAKIVKGNAEKTGRKGVKITISPNMIADSASLAHPTENSFQLTDLMLAMDAALDYDKENKKKSEVEQFARKLETVCSSLRNNQAKNYGFYWEYYVPYFIAMQDQKLLNTFSYIAFASNVSQTSEWLQSHKSDVDKFFQWSKSFEWKKTD